MQTLIQNGMKIFELKERVIRRDIVLFDHTLLRNCQEVPGMCSIVMTASNRSKQTYYTLDTIAKSSIKNVHVVIVDDSTGDPILVEKLRKYPFIIDFIQIRRENKCWHNPLVNYNIGFQYVRGSKVIIQNAEVCHIGDILKIVTNELQDNQYFVFDCAVTVNYEVNERIYADSDIGYPQTIERYIPSVAKKQFLHDEWYQAKHRNNKFHFLTALTRNSLNKIDGGFPWDFTFGSAYDDNDLLLKVVASGLEVINKFHDECGACGIHLFHGYSYGSWDRAESNDKLFHYKKKKFDNEGILIEFTKDPMTFRAAIDELIKST